jgi:hypothetical protein
MRTPVGPLDDDAFGLDTNWTLARCPVATKPDDRQKDSPSVGSSPACS